MLGVGVEEEVLELLDEVDELEVGLLVGDELGLLDEDELELLVGNEVGLLMDDEIGLLDGLMLLEGEEDIEGPVGVCGTNSMTGVG